MEKFLLYPVADSHCMLLHHVHMESKITYCGTTCLFGSSIAAAMSAMMVGPSIFQTCHQVTEYSHVIRATSGEARAHLGRVELLI